MVVAAGLAATFLRALEAVFLWRALLASDWLTITSSDTFLRAGFLAVTTDLPGFFAVAALGVAEVFGVDAFLVGAFLAENAVMSTVSLPPGINHSFSNS